MKYIKKNLRLEPKSLIKYRKTTQNATYKGFSDTDGLLKKALLKEQGYLCGYCMKRLLDEKDCSVEHYISQIRHPDSKYKQKKHKEKSLVYNNMIAVCLNDGEHCDKSRGNIPFKILNPHNNSCENYIKYTKQGKIKSRENEKVDFDLDTLKLNCQTLTDARIEFWEKAKDKFIGKHPLGTWTKKLLNVEKQIYIEKKDDKYKAFNNYIVFRFNELIKLPKYP